MSEPARNPIIDSLRPVDRDARPSFKLADTMYCPDCAHCHEIHANGCPTCGSKRAVPVERWINSKVSATGENLEIRYQGGQPDEVLCRNVEHIHVEQMGDRYWWAGIYLADGRLVHLRFTTKRATIALGIDVDPAKAVGEESAR